MSIREWSSYQLAVFDEIKSLRDKESGALMVQAVAGSGKTTTIIEALKLTKSTHRVILLAFNKHIAEELKRRVPPNVEAATLNSYGWRATREAFRGIQLDDWQTRNAMRDFISDPDERRRWDGAMKRLIGLKKATLSYGKKHDTTCILATDGSCPCPEGLVALDANEIASRYDLDLPTEPRFMEAAAQVWKKVCGQTMVCDFDGQWFLPVLKKLALPTYDWVFIDEAQDLCSTQIELLKRIAPRIVAIGDPMQSIYGFRGADPEAMDRLRCATNAKVLPLSICYRCPKAVVEKADESLKNFAMARSETGCTEWEPYIQASPTAIEGTVDEVDIKDLRQECQPGSWVLCRTTAPLVKECLKFIVEGVKATVKGRDIGQSLLSLIDKVGGHEIVEFTARLEEFHRAERSRLEAAGRDAQLQALDDRVESIYALCEGARTISDVQAKIKNVFSDEASNGVTFATAHRAKGLEADDIYILCPELMPFPKAKSEWAKKQERNLQYVAFTRAMKRLRMVTGTKATLPKLRKGVEGER